MLNSPNRDGDGPSRLSSSYFRQSLKRSLEVRNRAVLGIRSALQSRSLTASYFGHHVKSNFFLARSIESTLISPPPSVWPAPVGPGAPPAASHPMAQACPSRSQTAAPPGGRASLRH